MITGGPVKEEGLRQYVGRNALILERAEAGASGTSLAAWFRVSSARIHQIVNKLKKVGARGRAREKGWDWWTPARQRGEIEDKMNRGRWLEGDEDLLPEGWGQDTQHTTSPGPVLQTMDTEVHRSFRWTWGRRGR